MQAGQAEPEINDATSALLTQLAALKQAADFYATRVNAAFKPAQTLPGQAARLAQQAQFTARRTESAPTLSECAALIAEQGAALARQAGNDWRTRDAARRIETASSSIAARIGDHAFMAQVCGQRLYEWRQAEDIVG